jgi:hypothetical protein
VEGGERKTCDDERDDKREDDKGDDERDDNKGNDEFEDERDKRDDDKGNEERSTCVTLGPTRYSPWPPTIATTSHRGQQHNNQIKAGKDDAWLKGRNGSGMIVGGQII